jgi:hypothetical protein
MALTPAILFVKQKYVWESNTAKTFTKYHFPFASKHRVLIKVDFRGESAGKAYS